MQGNRTAARQEYETLFTLWKDADNDLPPLVRARPGYAKLSPNLCTRRDRPPFRIYRAGSPPDTKRRAQPEVP